MTGATNGFRNRWHGLLLGAALGLAALQAPACEFHGYTPDPTLVDLLLGTEQVVLARPAPSDPRRYAVLETLLGPAVGDLDIPVSAARRSDLRGVPDAAVLLVRDGPYGPWMDVAVLDSRFHGVVLHVLSRQSDWLLGRDADRATLFAGLVNDPSPALRRLALQELDRVPYDVLRKLRLPRVHGLEQALQEGDEDLRPIRILLAGLSGDAVLARQLAAQTETAAVRDVPHLGAYPTALVELGGEEAVRAVAARYLRDTRLPVATREKMLSGLALQYRASSGRTRRAIAQEVTALQDTTPDMVDAIGRQFGLRGRWSP